jgi:hypothetical protein
MQSGRHENRVVADLAAVDAALADEVGVAAAVDRAVSAYRKKQRGQLEWFDVVAAVARLREAA